MFLHISIRAIGSAVLSCCLLASQSGADPPVQIRVLSYNIHHGQGVDGELDLERIAGVINAARPDLVALQEVDRIVPRSRRVDQPAELARLTQLKQVFGKNLSLQEGGYGNAILSRFPIVQHQNHLLPSLNDGEQRGVLMAEIRVGKEGAPLVFLATHFDHRRPDEERRQSVEFISRLVRRTPGRAFLLAGDLNDVIGSATLNAIAADWSRVNEKKLPTIPVKRPVRQIDFIAYRPTGSWSVKKVEVIDESVASDHRPILAVLQWSPSKEVD